VAGQLKGNHNRYVSFRDSQGKKVFGKIDQDNRQLFIETADGDRVPLTTDNNAPIINTMYPSTTSKDLFDSLDTFRSDAVAGRFKSDRYVSFRDSQGNKILGRVSGHKSGDPVVIETANGNLVPITNDATLIDTMYPSKSSREYFKNRFRLEMTKDPEMNQMRATLNKNEVPRGSRQYVSYQDPEGSKIFGKIESVNEDQISVQTPDGNSIQIYGKQRGELAPSQASEDYFRDIDSFRSVLRSKGSSFDLSTKYVSYRDTQGKLVFGKVLKRGDNFFIETANGKFIEINKLDVDELQVTPSESAREYFHEFIEKDK